MNHLFFKFPLLLSAILALALTHCSSDFANRNKNEIIPSPDPSIGGGNGFDPNAPSPPAPSPKEDTCIPSETIVITPNSMDYGLNQVGQKECQTVRVNTCATFHAEVVPMTPAERTKETPMNFFIQVGGVEAGGRVASDPKTRTLDVCYRRGEPGSHEGRVNVVVEGNGAHVIPVQGITLPKLITIESPAFADPLKREILVWEKNSDPVEEAPETAPYLKFFKLKNVKGKINMAEYANLLKKKELVISVEGGISEIIPLGDDGVFSTTLQIPEKPNVYPVHFIMETVKGTLIETIRVIRYFEPEAGLEIRSIPGQLVSTTSQKPIPLETNADLLTLGVVFGDNLRVSGPETQPLELSLENITEDVLQPRSVEFKPAVKELSFSMSFDFKDEANKKFKCGTGFETPATSFCKGMPMTGHLFKGVNVIKVKACNEYTRHFASQDPERYPGGCRIFKTSILVDNDVPVINIISPSENNILNNETANTTITGTVENFKLEKTERKDVDGTKVDVTTCLLSMWVNTPIQQAPISLCEKKEGSQEYKYLKIVGAADGNNLSGNYKNIRKATFEVPVEAVTAPNQINKLTLYTNLVRVQAEDKNGHMAIAVRSFQRGQINYSSTQSIDSQHLNLITGQLGKVNRAAANLTERTPLMLNISESSIKDPKLIAALEYALNSEGGIKMADIVRGSAMPGDEDGDNKQDLEEVIDLDKDAGIPTGKTFWNGLTRDQQKDWIWRSLHGGMALKARAMSRYRTLRGLESPSNAGNLENIFFANGFNASQAKMCVNGNPENQYDLACDSCGYVISTALVPYSQYKHIYKGIQSNANLMRRPEWPRTLKSIDADDTFQGKWKIANLELKSGGFIDADACLVAEDAKVNGCDDIPGHTPQKPAFWGHMAAISLIRGGITGHSSDPVLPLLWNVGKLRIKLTDVLQIKKETLADGTFTNRLYFHKNKMVPGIGGSIDLQPFLGCKKFYQDKYGANYPIPFGCETSADMGDAGSVYPVLIERTSPAGEKAWADTGGNGNDPFLLDILQEKLLETFHNIFHCMLGKELVNPIINPVAFPYPKWVRPEDRISLDMALDNTNNEISLEEYNPNDANQMFSFKLNVKDADIIIDDQNLKAKVPFSIGANNIPSDRSRVWAHLFRNPQNDFEANHPWTEVTGGPYVSASIGIEEFMHAATHVLWKKGFREVIKLIDAETAEKLAMKEDTTIGLDKVILGRFGICNSIASGLLKTDLPAKTIFFTSIANLFTSDKDATHWDIKLPADSPPTVALVEPEYIEDPETHQMKPKYDATIQLGLSNVQIAVKELFDKGGNKFSVGKDDVVKIRVDGLLRLNVNYKTDKRRLEVFIAPLDKTPLYVSVISAPGAYNHDLVIRDLWANLFVNVFNKIGKDDATPSIALNLPKNASQFNALKSNTDKAEPGQVLEPVDPANSFYLENNLALGDNGKCAVGDEPQYAPEPTLFSGRWIPNLGYLFPNFTVYTVGEIESRLTAEEARCANEPGMTDNDIKKALCENMGIEEISFADGSPLLELDTDNGYIHISTELAIKLFNWLNQDE